MAPRKETSSDDPRAALSTAVLSDALAAAQARVQRLQQLMSETEREMNATREEARLLERILALRDSGGGMLNSEHPVADAHAFASSNGTTARSVVEHVIAVLEETHRPLHIQELMRLLSTAQIKLPGAGTQANLIGLLRRDARIV